MPTIKSSTSTYVWACSVGLVALLWATLGLSQPLWLDELHSSWAIADGWTELLDRAKQGNQTPAYFIVLKCLSWIAGDQQEGLIRLPSVLAWSMALASMAWMLLQTSKTADDWAQTRNGNYTKSTIGNLVIALFCGSVLLDPWQYFYAVEGRVYALVQLLNLWSWFTVSKILVGASGIRAWSWIGWTALAIALQHLHITTSLAIAVQGLLLLSVKLRSKNDRLYLLGSSSVVGINTIWLLYNSKSIWQRRQQWESFAGDGSVSSLVEIFPFAAILIPVLAGWGTHQLIRWRQPSGAPTPSEHPTNSALIQPNRTLPHPILSSISIWGIAAFVPCLLGWLITRFDIAPIFHYRFVIVSALPLYSLAGYLLLCQSIIAVRCVTVSAILCWMFFSYGPLASAQQGRWLNERTEDWRSAIDFVQQSYTTSQSLWCYAGLIEGKGLDLPLSTSMSEYLSFPLRTRFRVRQNSVAIEARGLVADRKLWKQQIRQYHSSNSQPSSESSAVDCWVVYRGNVERFHADLKSAGIVGHSDSVPVHSFGNVSVARLTVGR